jgi:CBS domain containing-hemolysin-like protein
MFIIFGFILLIMLCVSEVAVTNVSLASIEAYLGKGFIYDQLVKVKSQSEVFLIVCVLLELLVQYFLSISIDHFVNGFNSQVTIYFLIFFFSFLDAVTTIIAKIIALRQGINVLKVFIWPIAIIYNVLYPIGYCIEKIVHFILSVLSLSNVVKLDFRTEILRLLDESEEDLEEMEMIEYLLNLRKITVDRIMTPRALFIHCDLYDISGIKKALLETGKSDIIIWENTPDNIIGTLNAQDLFNYILENEENALFEENEKNYNALRQLVIPLTLVPNTTNLYKLLTIFMKKSYKFLFVVDEYGDILGIVTWADMIDEITGQDEPIDMVENGCIVSGICSLHSINRIMDWNLPEEYLTVSGLVMYINKAIPENNAIIYLNDDYRFTIIEKQKQKLSKIKIEFTNNIKKDEEE